MSVLWPPAPDQRYEMLRETAYSVWTGAHILTINGRARVLHRSWCHETSRAVLWTEGSNGVRMCERVHPDTIVYVYRWIHANNLDAPQTAA